MKKPEINLEESMAQVKRHSRKSKECRKATTKLLIGIQQLDMFNEYRQNYPADVYSDARSKTIEHISTRINEYEPTKEDLATWAKTILEFYLNGKK